MLMRTRDYCAIPIEPDLAPLEQIFDQQIMDFLRKMIFFWMYDKLAGSADNNKKMLGKVVYNLF